MLRDERGTSQTGSRMMQTPRPKARTAGKMAQIPSPAWQIPSPMSHNQGWEADIRSQAP